MEEKASRLTERAFTWLVAVTGVVLLILNVPDFSDIHRVLELVFMLVLVAISEFSEIPLPLGMGTVSMSAPIAYTATVLYGPDAVWVAALGTLRKRDLQGKVPLRLVLFNRAMITMSVLAFSTVYKSLGGIFGSMKFPQDILPFVIGAGLYTGVNALLASTYWSLETGASFVSVWRTNIRWGLPSMLALVPVAMLMVVASQQSGPWFLVLFYIPLMVSKYSMDKYVEMRSAYREMATALSNAIDARDSYTRGHSERVADYVALLAKELRMDEDEIEVLRYVGLLHDVGKVGIPDAIMKKPGAYTYEEYEEMKKHANIGADMLEGLKFLGKGQDWVRYHHERWDGRGFPKGLAGKEIPFEARILACADSFDAMTTDRPYKAKMDLETAKEELIRCSGTQFDPKIVEAMVKVIDKMMQDDVNP